jgi:hypothetical protein
MKLLCFQAKRFRWKTHSKTLPQATDTEIEAEVRQVVVIFIHAEASDAEESRTSSVQRQSLKHIKWLANKRELKNIVLHSVHPSRRRHSRACVRGIIYHYA